MNRIVAKSRPLMALCATGAAIFMLMGQLSAAPRPRSGELPSGMVVKAPLGWVQFCRENIADCHGKVVEPKAAKLDRRTWQELVSVNLKTNNDIEQVSDDELYGVPEYWTYPIDNKGDCEDIALEKKRRLIALGWPREALLMTVVRDLKGDGHAVLMAKTERGDYILDNNTNEVKLWFETGYGYVKRQSMNDPNVWVSLGPSPLVAQTASPPR